MSFFKHRNRDKFFVKDFWWYEVRLGSEADAVFVSLTVNTISLEVLYDSEHIQINTLIVT